jgi:hypothetical protein
MPLATWKVLLRRSDQVGYHYATMLHRASEPTAAEEIHLLVDGQVVRGTVIEVHKDFSTRAGVDGFTVMADEIKATARPGSGEDPGEPGDASTG